MLQNYRNTDPETSVIAGMGVESHGKRLSRVLMAVKAVKLYPGRTAAELEHLTGYLDSYEFNRRLSDACHEKLVKHGIKRKCTVKGTPCMTWEPMNG